MSRIDQYKNKLLNGEKRTINDYESDINDFLDDLDNNGFLIKSFSKSQSERLQKLVSSSNASAKLFNELNKIFDGDVTQMQFNVARLKSAGLDIGPQQYGSVMCHNYQVISERLKLHLVTVIDFDKMGLTNAHSRPLGSIIHKLKSEFPQNKFVDYMDTKIRNSVTHYTYFFDNGNIILCNGYFDDSPTAMPLVDFMMESKKLNILTEALFIIYLDKHFPGENLSLNI